ncbi:MAG: hypothetical protein RSE18_00165 [Acinetobacter sp.]
MASDQDEIKIALNEIKTEVKSVSEKVIELSVINRNHESTSVANSQKIESIESDVNFAKGSIALVKAVGLSLCASVLLFSITFGTWVVTSLQATGLAIAEVRKDISILEIMIKELKKENHDDERQR